MVGLLSMLAMSDIGCSRRDRLVSRISSWGTGQVVVVPAGRKLVDAGWKGSTLWVLTRPAEEGEGTDRTWTFDEYAPWGIDNHIQLRETPR